MTALAVHRPKTMLIPAQVIGHGPGPTMTIIENPSLEHCIGLLFAKHYDKFPLSKFRDIFYVRIESETGDVKAKEKYDEAKIYTSEIMGFKYNFIAADYGKPAERAFQAGNKRPYCISHIDTSNFTKLIDEESWDRWPLEALELAGILAARSSSLFSFKDEKLEMPDDYASVRMGSS